MVLTPLRVIYGRSLHPTGFAKLAESWPELGHLWFWGWTPIAGRSAHDLLIAHVPSGGCSPPTIVARPLCSVPWQDDFPRGNVPTGKGALRSIHWKLDDRPISMKLYEFAAIDGPEETSATEMHQRIIAMATE